MQRLKIDVKKIAKEHMFEGAKGTYLDLTLMDNRDGPDQYGYDGFIIQDVGKEKREAGIKGPIIGNWKYIGQKPNLGIMSPEYGQRETAPAQRNNAAVDNMDDDIPFALPRFI